MNAPMTDPTPTWVELLKSLLHGADRGVMKSAGAGQKATRFFPGKNARELAPTVFTELRKRGWVRLIDREKGFWQVEQAFVDQHRLGITIDVQPALDPLPRGKAAQKKQPSSPADELEQLMAQRQAEEQRIHVLIHAARQQLVDAITHAQQAMAEGIASAEQALNDARTTGAAAVAAAQAALAAHEKKFAKELKAAPPSAGKK